MDFVYFSLELMPFESLILLRPARESLQVLPVVTSLTVFFEIPYFVAVSALVG